MQNLAKVARTSFSLVFVGALAIVWAGCGGDDGSEDSGAAEGATDTPSDNGEKSAFGTRDGGSSDDFDASFGDPGGDGGVVGDAGDNPDECLDPADQGDTPATAKALPDLNDSVDNSLPLRGVLNGDVDEDFYAVTMKDTSTGKLNPYMVSRTSGIEICMFVQCAKDPSKTDFNKCNKGTKMDKTGPNGMSGCCASSPGELEVSAGCSGFTLNDTLKVYMRVKQTANKCTAYEVGYHG